MVLEKLYNSGVIPVSLRILGVGCGEGGQGIELARWSAGFGGLRVYFRFSIT